MRLLRKDPNMEDKDQSKQILKSNLEKRALLEKTKHLKKMMLISLGR